MLKKFIENQLKIVLKRFNKLNILISESENISNNFEIKKYLQEKSKIEKIISNSKEYLIIYNHNSQAKELLSDPEIYSIAKKEIKKNDILIKKIISKLYLFFLPIDTKDNSNSFLEIRAGTGGEESALFSLKLLRMYSKYAEKNNWTQEFISKKISYLGGYKQIIIFFKGKNVYKRLKFESGVHRVQRVPNTENQGRIHTSACTVAVLPEVKISKDVEIKTSELRIDTFKASGSGGQHVNKTNSAVRITHLPTNLSVECQEDRSQYKNKEKAIKILYAKLKDKKLQEIQNKESKIRKKLIGSGDRSERIRTYNLPKSRLTDHRINLVLYNLQQIFDGNLDELINNLTLRYQSEKLETLGYKC